MIENASHLDFGWNHIPLKFHTQYYFDKWIQNNRMFKGFVRTLPNTLRSVPNFKKIIAKEPSFLNAIPIDYLLEMEDFVIQIIHKTKRALYPCGFEHKFSFNLLRAMMFYDPMIASHSQFKKTLTIVCTIEN